MFIRHDIDLQRVGAKVDKITVQSYAWLTIRWLGLPEKFGGSRGGTNMGVPHWTGALAMCATRMFYSLQIKSGCDLVSELKANGAYSDMLLSSTRVSVFTRSPRITCPFNCNCSLESWSRCDDAHSRWWYRPISTSYGVVRLPVSPLINNEISTTMSIGLRPDSSIWYVHRQDNITRVIH